MENNRWHRYCQKIKSQWKWVVKPTIKIWLKRSLKCPFILRHTHEKILSDRYQHYARLKIENNNQLDKDRKTLQELIGKLTNLKFEVIGKSNLLGHSYRVCVDIDPELVNNCFIHGGDQYAIDFMCENLGREVAYQMKTINFKRLAIDASKEYDKNRYPNLKGWDG